MPYDFTYLIYKSNEAGARQEFEDICAMLLQSIYSDDVHKIEACQGDGGIDVMIGDFTNPIKVYQCKFFANRIGESQKSQIRSSFKRACEDNRFRMSKWTLCTSCNMTLDAKRWFDKWAKEKVEETGVEISHLDGNNLITLLHKYDLYGKVFPEKVTDEPTVTTQQTPEDRMANLSEKEQKMVRDFAATIDLEDTIKVLQYGAGTQKKMADFADTVLANVRTQDLGEVGDLIVNVVSELKGFETEENKGFLGFFRKQAFKLSTIKTKFTKAEVNVARIGDALERHQIRLLKDSAVLDKMYEQNQHYFKELTMYILAGRQKIAETRSGKLAELQAKAQLSGLAEDAQAARDLSDKCDRFEKKIHDLELTRAISIQTAPQIRMIQNNDNVMVEKIQTTLMNTIPLWKNQMVLALGIAHSTEAAAAQRQVRDITGSLLKQNAERLHLASVETAKEAERGIVDIETLKATNAKLIQTFDDVMKIQADGRAKRLAAEAEMVKMENDLKQKLLQIRNGN